MGEHLGRASFDLERILPLELIRQHTKTDDVETVSDEQLVLYRRAAFETAERYTGRRFLGQTTVQEVLSQPPGTGAGYGYSENGGFWYHDTKQAFALPFAYIFGDGQTQEIPVTIGSRRVRLPFHPGDFGFGCCAPCKTRKERLIQYTAGYQCEEDIPAAFVLGCLKYISHVIENPGDGVTGSNTSNRLIANFSDSNNPALASGALDMWRTIKDDAI